MMENKEEESNDVDDETSLPSSTNKKKKLVITSTVSLLIVLCIAIGVSFSPKQKHSATLNDHEKDKFTNTNDIIKVDNDISHFLMADTTEVTSTILRSEIGTNNCPSGKGLWNMKLVTDLYGYETGRCSHSSGISFSFFRAYDICSNHLNIQLSLI